LRQHLLPDRVVQLTIDYDTLSLRKGKSGGDQIGRDRALSNLPKEMVDWLLRQDPYADNPSLKLTIPVKSIHV
jgi:hypothetical protein